MINMTACDHDCDSHLNIHYKSESVYCTPFCPKWKCLLHTILFQMEVFSAHNFVPIHTVLFLVCACVLSVEQVDTLSSLQCLWLNFSFKDGVASMSAIKLCTCT